MSSLIAILNKTGKIENNGCTLTIRGDRFLMEGPTGKHSLDIDSTNEARLVAHWVGFYGPISGDTEVDKKPSRTLRAYAVTLATTDYVVGWSSEPSNAGIVYGRDRNEAMRKARDLGRDLIGPYGPGYKVSVRLT